MHLGRWLPQGQLHPKTGERRPGVFSGDCVEPLLPTCPAPTWPQISLTPPSPPHRCWQRPRGAASCSGREPKALPLKCSALARPLSSLWSWSHFLEPLEKVKVLD